MAGLSQQRVATKVRPQGAEPWQSCGSLREHRANTAAPGSPDTHLPLSTRFRKQARGRVFPKTETIPYKFCLTSPIAAWYAFRQLASLHYFQEITKTANSTGRKKKKSMFFSLACKRRRRG